MERTPVKSSQIASIGFDPKTNTMEIEFNGSRAVYLYHNITPEIHSGLIGAESIGKHFGKHIRNNPKHAFKRLESK